ncbi:MAG: hypothetical protein ACXAEU_18960 [Candidatus Hodarchaeales archaeon]
MDMKEYFDTLSKLPVDEVTVKITETLNMLNSAPEGERSTRLNALMEALAEQPEDVHAKVIQARFEAFTRVSPEVKSSILVVGAQVMGKQPENFQKREQLLVQKIAPNLSDSAKSVMQEFIAQLPKK